MQCANCGRPMEYSTLLDNINRTCHKLFHCYHCLIKDIEWQLNKYVMLDTLAAIYIDNIPPDDIA